MDQSQSREPQGLQEIIRAVRDLSAKTSYPITNFGQLAQALGGDQGSVSLLGDTYKISELRHIIPQEYFPIESEEDLVMKVASGYASRPGAAMRPRTMGQKLSAPPQGHSPPPSAPPTAQSQGKGIPELRGNKRR